MLELTNFEKAMRKEMLQWAIKSVLETKEETGALNKEITDTKKQIENF